MKKVTKEQVEEAIIALLNGHELFPYDLEPEEVNNGLCEEFSQCVLALLEFPENLQIECGSLETPEYWHHVWLTLDGCIYFDSECEYGTSEIGDLPYFQRN